MPSTLSPKRVAFVSPTVRVVRNLTLFLNAEPDGLRRAANKVDDIGRSPPVKSGQSTNSAGAASLEMHH